MIMVRRRARPAKETATSADADAGEHVAATDAPLHGQDVAAAVAGANLLDDQYFASPKRKDCRLMTANDNLKALDMADIVGVVDIQQTNHNNNNNSNSHNNKGKTTKSEQKSGDGRTIGVPLATRSQTRTIENFFKANAAAKNAKKMTTNQTTEEQKTISSTTITPTNTVTTALIHEEAAAAAMPDELVYETHSIASSSSCFSNSPPHYQPAMDELLLQEDQEHSNDSASGSSECTLHEVNVRQLNGGAGGDFQTHRSTLRDSHSSSSSATDNIFLQEPVLTLDIDRTPTKASSMQINKSFELASAVFSSPPAAALSACMLNGRFNQIVTLNAGQLPEVAIHNGFALDLQDSSSCDSGVACSDATKLASVTPPARQRKPATPHRILCPSPIKALPRPAHDAMMGKASAAATNKNDLLSPRKSPRKMAAVAAAFKSRRRLNTPKPQAPYQHSTQSQIQIETQSKDEAQVVVLLDDDDDDEEEEDDEDDVHALLKAAEEVENQNKARPVMNNKNNHNVNTMLKPAAAPPKKPSAKAKPRIKSQLQQPLPLAATNGNREMTDFFPVRRSVRKTKTVVKEEMMRNLEQAVLEERSEGLQIRHFEGKGRGVVAERPFKRNEFVVEYVGDLIAISEATDRERRYALDENAGCYMYYFKHKNQQYCIDATVDTGKLGRLINHSRTGNLMTKVVVIKQRPHLVLLAKDDIEVGEELTYDYGDRSKESLLHHPWLAF